MNISSAYRDFKSAKDFRHLLITFSLSGSLSGAKVQTMRQTLDIRGKNKVLDFVCTINFNLNRKTEATLLLE